MDTDTDFAHIIQHHRKRLGLCRAELARAVGVTDVLVGFWERGKIKQIGHRRLTDLAKILDIPIDHLVSHNARQEASLDATSRQHLESIIQKVRDRYHAGDALYLEPEDLALLAEHTSLSAVLQIDPRQ